MRCNRTHSIRSYDPLQQLCWIQTASFKSRKNARSRHLFHIPRLWAGPSRGGWIVFTTPNLQTLQQELPRAAGFVVHQSNLPWVWVLGLPTQSSSLERADVVPAAPILSLLPSSSNLKLRRVFIPWFHEWQGSSSAALYPKMQLNCPWKNSTLQWQYFLCSLGGAKCTTHWELLVKKSYFSLLAVMAMR